MSLNNLQNITPENSARGFKNNKKKYFFVFIVFTLIISVIVNYNYSKSLDSIKKQLSDQSGKNSEDIKRLQNGIFALNAKYFKMQANRDSMQLVLLKLNPYRPLVGLLAFRDSVQSLLPFKVGSIVYLKPDSALAVIKDIVISGSDYEFNIQYRVITKSRSELLLNPALINK